MVSTQRGAHPWPPLVSIHTMVPSESNVSMVRTGSVQGLSGDIDIPHPSGVWGGGSPAPGKVL